MNTNRFVILLVTATLLLQASILYKQSASPSTSSPPPAVRDAPKDTILELKGLPIKGNVAARVVLVEFSDYECPFCAQHANGVGRELQRNFVANGKIRHAFANNPLPIHQNARLLASAAMCAGAQDRYWEMHDRLFQDAPKTKSAILSLAAEVVANSSQFAACLDRGDDATKQIDADITRATSLGLRGTPGFAIGIVNGDGRVSIKKLIVGAQAQNVFDESISALLESKDRS